MTETTSPLTPEQLLERLDRLGIDHTTVSHPRVFTVEESKALRGELPGGHTKNLFLRNKKGRMWLVVCPEDRAVDLKQLGERLGSGRLSFGSAERLKRYLGVISGAVTPFGVVNDRDGQVQVALDRALLGETRLHFHPLDNDRTTGLTPDELMRFLESEGHAPQLIEL